MHHYAATVVYIYIHYFYSVWSADSGSDKKQGSYIASYIDKNAHSLYLVISTHKSDFLYKVSHKKHVYRLI